MADIKSSKTMQDLATAAFNAGEPMKKTVAFDIYRLRNDPNGFLGNYVLLLFQCGYSFSKGNIPDGLIIPVAVGNRKGYLLHERHFNNITKWDKDNESGVSRADDQK